MEPIAILVGIFMIVMGAYVWRLAEKTPEDQLIPRPLGVWWSRERAYFTAVLLWLLGVLVTLVGLIP